MSFTKLRYRVKDTRPGDMKKITAALKQAYKNINEAYNLSKAEFVDTKQLELLLDQSHVFLEQARELSKSI